MVQVRGLIEGMVPDVLRVEFEGRTQEVEPQANGLFTALFGTTPTEGPREVRVQAVVGDTVVLEERFEVLVLVEGWSSIEIRIEQPVDGVRVDGVFFARGTVSSNYTVEEVFVIVDDDPERRYVPDDLLNWSVAIDIAGLEDGEHTLVVMARDTVRAAEGVEVVFLTGEPDGEKLTSVGLWDVVAVLALVGVFVHLLRTKPPRVSEDPSKA
jgi:hypothetical protein